MGGYAGTAYNATENIMQTQPRGGGHGHADDVSDDNWMQLHPNMRRDEDE